MEQLHREYLRGTRINYAIMASITGALVGFGVWALAYTSVGMMPIGTGLVLALQFAFNHHAISEPSITKAKKALYGQ